MTTDATTLTPQDDASARPNGITRLRRLMSQSGPTLRDFFVEAVLQLRVLGKSYAGIMHLLLFWGMTVQIIGTGIALLQMELFVPLVVLEWPRGNAYLLYELLMDLAGVAILLGVAMAAYRRYAQRPKMLETRWDDTYALIILAVIPLVGYGTEALRFVATAPPWAHWSPVGNLLANLLNALGLTPEAAWSLHGSFYWAHAIVGLIFIASIPFTKLRHLITGPLNILLRQRGQASALTPIADIEEAEVLGVGQVTAFTPQQLLSFDACVRCGRCEEVCPAAISGMPYSPRAFVQSLRGTMVDTLIRRNGDLKQTEDVALDGLLGQDAPWYCTTCGACLDVCPMYVNPISEIIDLRRYQALMTGEMPGSVGATLRNVERQGNPWGMAESRLDWAEGLDVPVIEPGEDTEIDVLLFVGCAAAFDDRNKQSMRAFVRLLQAAAVDFAVLGDAELCCGETSRRLGNEYIFQVMAEENIETFGAVRFKRLVTQCTHCFNTLKHEYPQFGGEYDVQHYTELLAELQPQLGPKLSNGSAVAGKRVTFHDPCYLGRYNGLYDQPRDLLDTTGAARVEMARSGANSFCCGGGGGQMWLETEAETRINNRRLGDALDANAEVVATACPYCLLMFDDAIRSLDKADQVQVMDVAEVLASRLENGG